MRLRSSFFLVVLAVLVHAVVARAQFVTGLQLETEEDVNDAFYEGDIDSEQREELLDLIRNPVDLNGTSLDQLLLVPGVTPHDVARIREWRKEYGDFETPEDVGQVPGVNEDLLRIYVTVRAAGPSVPRWRLEDLRGSARVQVTRDFWEEGDRRNDWTADVRARTPGRKWRLRVRLREEEDEAFGFYERSLELEPEEGPVESLLLGNSWKALGLGVTVGRRVALTRSLREPAHGSFLAPRMGRYNGVRAKFRAFDLSPEVLISENRYKEVTDRVWAAAVTREESRWNAGAIVATMELGGASTSFERTYLALYGGTDFGLLHGEAETSWSVGHGLGTEVRLEASGFKFESGATFWHYGADYINAHGGGTADVDRTMIEVLPDEEIDIGDRQVGERGVLLETEIDLGGGMTAEGSFSQGHNVLDGETDQRGDLVLAWRENSRRRALMRALWDTDDTEGEGQGRQSLVLDGRSDVGPWWDLRARTVFRTRETSSGDVDSAEIWLESSFRRLAPLSPWVRLRWKDNDLASEEDAWFELQLEERFDFLGRYRFEARVRSRLYQGMDREPDPDVEARISLRVNL